MIFVNGLIKDFVKDSVKCEINQTSSNNLNFKAISQHPRPPTHLIHTSLTLPSFLS